MTDARTTAAAPDRDAPRRAGSWRVPALWIALIAIKLALVLVAARGVKMIDQKVYRRLAHSLIEGRGLAFGDEPTVAVTPGYPILLSLVFRVAGDPSPAPYVVNVLLSLALALACGRLFIWLGGPRAWARAVAIVVFFLPGHTQYAACILTEIPFSACFVFSLLFWERARQRPESLAAWALLGLFHVLGVMIRPTLFFVTPVVIVWPLAEARFRGRALTGAAIATLIFLAVWAPWVVRNWRVFGRFIPLNAAVTLDMELPGESKAPHEIASPDRSEAATATGRSARVDRLEHPAIEWFPQVYLRAEPARYLALSLRRSWRFWIYDHPWQRTIAQDWRAADKAGEYARLLGRPALQAFSVALLVLLLASAWVLRGDRACRPYWLLLIYFTLFHALILPIVRYSVPVQGLAVVLIALAAARGATRRGVPSLSASGEG